MEYAGRGRQALCDNEVDAIVFMAGHPSGTIKTATGTCDTKLVNIALPRVRDFRGISGKAFDGRGNYSLGIKEHIIFPEIDYDKIDKIKGLNVTVVTTAQTDEEGKELLKLMGMPFRN